MTSPAKKRANAKYRATHKAAKAAYMKAWREANKAAKAACDAEYRATHKVEKAAYYAAHKVEAAASMAGYRATHKEAIAAYMAEYQAAHKVAKAVCDAAWRANNPDKTQAAHARRRALKKGAESDGTILRDVVVLFGLRCLCCGAEASLTVDHVIPLSLGGSDLIENKQPLCMHCNDSKGTKTVDYRVAGGGK